MKWVTRARPKVDRVAGPWLILRFVDPAAEFLYVPPDEVLAVARREGATPFEVPGVQLGHHGAGQRDLTPESRGLEAIAEGFRLVYADDHALLAAELPVYDALYATCVTRLAARV